MIYFLLSNNKIKIGYSDNPSKRIPAIQTASPDPISVLLIIEGGYEKESALHKSFKAFKSSGEWFYYSDEIKKYVNSNLQFDRRYEFGFLDEDFKGNEQIMRLRKIHGLTLQQLGKKLNITGQSVKEMQDREKNGAITIKLMQNFGETLGYKFEYRFVPKQ